MAALIWAGAGLALLGVVGLAVSAGMVIAARRAGEAALRAQMARALPLNLAALGVSVLGLLCVVVGIALG